MNPNLSNRINAMATSATLAMAAKARELRQEGKDIIGLSLGEPDFNVPEFVKEAAINAVNENYHSYTPVDGYGDLKNAIITKFKRDNNLDYSPSQIVVSTGAKQSLANLAMVLLNDGDEVLLPAPNEGYMETYKRKPVDKTILTFLLLFISISVLSLGFLCYKATKFPKKRNKIILYSK